MEIGSIGFIVVLVIVLLFILILPSIRIIGPTEVGLAIKRFSIRSLEEDSPIAFRGEAGYQADLLMPGWRWKFWVVYRVEKFPWVQVPAGQIGVVISQVGAQLPIGAKSATYNKAFGNFSDLLTFIDNGGQKGVQRAVLPPGTLMPIHPVAFLVITKNEVYGIPVSPELQQWVARGGKLTPMSFGLRPDQLDVVRIEPKPSEHGELIDMVGVITTFEGDPLPASDIASRLGGFADIRASESQSKTNAEQIELILGSQNHKHNNYQDFQAFLDNGGKIGLQHDPLLYGAYTLNPFLVGVEKVPMLVVQQGQVAVVKAYVGLPTEDISGAQFKYGSLVRPGHRGIWEEPLRTGKYPINPRCYQAEIVPTSILTLNWAVGYSQAHKLDERLQTIEAKSREGFIFKVDLQVQIHVPDTKAPRVISIVGTMANLVNEVLQPAVGNHFRDRLQSMPAIKFIETRQQVQVDAFEHIREQLAQYEVETKGVYIQDVVLPDQLVSVLTQREIANQEIETFKRQREAQDQRIETEKARGTADMQEALARARVGVDIQTNNALARKAEADGEATYISQTGIAKGAEVRAVGLARAEAYKAQADALGKEATTIVNAIDALSRVGGARLVPEILSIGGGSSTDSLAGALMKYLGGRTDGGVVIPHVPVPPVPPPAP